MSRAEDRIPVPTNGHRALLSVDPETGAEARAPDQAVDADALVGTDHRIGVAVNASPAQLAVGFGIITWVIVYLVGRWWRRR